MYVCVFSDSSLTFICVYLHLKIQEGPIETHLFGSTKFQQGFHWTPTCVSDGFNRRFNHEKPKKGPILVVKKNIYLRIRNQIGHFL